MARFRVKQKNPELIFDEYYVQHLSPLMLRSDSKEKK